MKQLTLAAVGFERYAKTTQRAAFLAEMERVVPWSALCALIEPFYPKPGNGRPPVGVERMLASSSVSMRLSTLHWRASA
jgi:IS5 family transposase